jgi:hypothetical protein
LGYSLKLRPYIGLAYGRYLQFRILKFPLNYRISLVGNTEAEPKKASPVV